MWTEYQAWLDEQEQVEWNKKVQEISSWIKAGGCVEGETMEQHYQFMMKKKGEEYQLLQKKQAEEKIREEQERIKQAEERRVAMLAQQQAKFIQRVKKVKFCQKRTAETQVITKKVEEPKMGRRAQRKATFEKLKATSIPQEEKPVLIVVDYIEEQVEEEKTVEQLAVIETEKEEMKKIVSKICEAESQAIKMVVEVSEDKVRKQEEHEAEKASWTLVDRQKKKETRQINVVVQSNNPKYRLCRSVKEGKTCEYGPSCHFAHSLTEKLCMYGSTCGYTKLVKFGVYENYGDKVCPCIHKDETDQSHKNRQAKQGTKPVSKPVNNIETKASVIKIQTGQTRWGQLPIPVATPIEVQVQQVQHIAQPQVQNQNKPTKMCVSVTNRVKCPHGTKCRYAHKISELDKKICHFGFRCLFAKFIKDGIYRNTGAKACPCWHDGETELSYSKRMGL
jgi:hypothetical protein